MKKKSIKWILVILWMGLIFYLSSRDRDESTNQSRSVVNQTKIVEIYEQKNNVDNETALEDVDRIFRKSAHAIVYLILSVLLCSALNEYNLSVNNILLISFIICFIYSCSDEAHQLLVSGRSGEIRDVLIDNIGTILGLIPYYLYKRRKS